MANKKQVLICQPTLPLFSVPCFNAQQGLTHLNGSFEAPCVSIRSMKDTGVLKLFIHFQRGDILKIKISYYQNDLF